MTKATQTSRKTRASATRKKVWEPLAKLDVPENKKDVDMEYVWVRHELLITLIMQMFTKDYAKAMNQLHLMNLGMTIMLT